MDEGIDHNASPFFTAPKTATDLKIEQLEDKIIELESQIKWLKGDIEEINLNAAGLALNFNHIDKCSELLFSVRMVRTLVWVDGSM